MLTPGLFAETRLIKKIIKIEKDMNEHVKQAAEY